MNEFPKNCTECEYSKTCQRYYGARGCRYEEEIRKSILEREKKYEEKIN